MFFRRKYRPEPVSLDAIDEHMQRMIEEEVQRDNAARAAVRGEFLDAWMEARHTVDLDALIDGDDIKWADD